MAMATHTSREYLTATGSHDEPAPATTHGEEELELAYDGSDDGSGEGADHESVAVLEPGVYVDRYRVLDVIGTGGIGVVYAAFDEALGRNVALKLLRPNASASRKMERRRARLVREAQALARLSHPNVVPVYEVGMFEDRVFLAMEYIEGSTMRRWLRRSQRSWTDILDKYIQAGRGLAAAHAGDIVHRDFKPDNVLVGEDGRVRVLDFGLATPVPEAMATGRYTTLSVEDQASSRTRPKSAPQTLTESVSSLITAHGKVMGTPAYMSPEQSRGDPADARADQYSFCVALWEALFGERPHGPPTATARVRIHRRLSERGVSGIDVPQSVQRALERGLSLNPADRFADMDGLLAVLSGQPASWRQSWRRWALASALPLAGAAALLVATLAPSAAETCPRELDALDGVWDTQIRAQAHARLTATERPYADATWDSIERSLDRWSTRWHDARVDACEDTKVRGSQSLVLLDMRMACLDRQKNALAAVTETLAGDPPVASETKNERSLAADARADAQLETALAAVLALPDPDRCERSALIGGAKLLHEDPHLDQQLKRQRQRLARARGLLDSAQLDDALALVDQVMAASGGDKIQAAPFSQGGSQPLLAEAKVLRGQILASTGELDDARDELRAAMLVAQTTGHDTVTVEACAALVGVLERQGELDSAADWADLGRATLARIGGDPHLEATLRMASARLAIARADLHAALGDQRRVLELREQLHGGEHVEVAKALNELVSTETALGLYEEAEADIERALTILITEFGMTHPEVGLAYSRHAALQRAQGLESKALSMLLDALAIFELAYAEHHPHIADTYGAISASYAALGQHEPALSALVQARKVTVALYDGGGDGGGDEHPALVPMIVDIAALLHTLGRDDAALAELELAEGLVAKTLAPPHGSARQHDAAQTSIALVRGDVHAARGRNDKARVAYGLARELLSHADEPNEQLLGLVLGQLASVEHRAGEIEAAVEHQREALELRERALGVDAPELAMHLTWLGVGLVDLGRFADAEQVLVRALELLDHSNDHDATQLRGRARLALAKVAWSAVGQRPHARELARAAIGDLGRPERESSRLTDADTTTTFATHELDAAKQWLAQHGG